MTPLLSRGPPSRRYPTVSSQTRTPTSFNDLVSNAPNIESFVVCTWNQADSDGDVLATVAQLDLTGGMFAPLDALNADGWYICSTKGDSYFLTHGDDASEVLQLAYLPEHSAAELNRTVALQSIGITCTAGD